MVVINPGMLTRHLQISPLCPLHVIEPLGNIDKNASRTSFRVR